MRSPSPALGLAVFGAFMLGGCGGTIVNPDTVGHAPSGYSASLLSASFTRAAVARLTLNCGAGASFWKLSPQPPSATDSDWSACQGPGAFVASVPLTPGLNPLKVWFKSGLGVLGTSAAALTSVMRADSLELLDPTPGADEGDDLGRCVSHCGAGFAGSVTVLSNGNLVATDPRDSSQASFGGAVHLYNGVTGTIIASLYGDDADDATGSGGVVALPNGNYVVISPVDDVAGVTDAGSVKLMNGSTGAEISSLSGDDASDGMGSGGVVALPNGNYVVSSPVDDVAGVSDAGSVKLMNGRTGAEISSLSGNNASDFLGNGSVVALPNGNYVVSSPVDDVTGVTDAGSVKLISGSTGAQISSLDGDNPSDFLGNTGVVALPNGNYVVSSPNDDVAGLSNAGSVKLMNGSSGAEISSLNGDNANDSMGNRGAVALPNGNYVVSSPFDKVAGLSNAGSVKLMNGNTGAQISSLSGDNVSDVMGTGGVVVLPNGNYVVISPSDHVAGLSNAGSVKLMNGNTGAQISSLDGDNANDSMGYSGVVGLLNGNYVVSSSFDDVAGVTDAGSVKLMNGSTGAEISSLNGDNATDHMGSGGVVKLPNGNYVVSSPDDDVAGVSNAGSVKLMNGNTGAQISSLSGDNVGDIMGTGGVVALSNGNYVVISPSDHVAGLSNAGSVKLMNGSTGAQISSLSGDNANDLLGIADVVTLPNGGYAVLNPAKNNHGLAASGQILLLPGDSP